MSKQSSSADSTIPKQERAQEATRASKQPSEASVESQIASMSGVGQTQAGVGESRDRSHEEKKIPETVLEPKHDHDPSSIPGASF